MGIPQLETCCCCCSTKTGSKIIGWWSLIGSILGLILTGLALAGIYFAKEHPEDTRPEVVKLRQHFEIARAIAILLIISYAVETITSLILLFGLYQKKGQLVFIWVAVSLAMVILSVISIIIKVAIINNMTDLSETIGLVFQLYLILVVYSYYRQMSGGANYA